MIADSQKNRAAEQQNPAGQNGLANRDQDNANILRVAHIFVEANDDQLARWIIRRWYAATAMNEINEAPDNHPHPRQEGIAQ